MINPNLRIGNHQYNVQQQQLLNLKGELCTLRQQSLSVLHHLAVNANKVVTKNELFSSVWKGISVTDDSLVQCVADIRRLLQDQKHEVLKTVPRRGYLLAAHELVASPPVNIPEDLLPFLGRDHELKALRDMLSDPVCRLISVIGMGGVGKSRLAKTLARQVTAQFADGLYFVELVSVQNPELMPATIAAALGISIQGTCAPLEQLQTAVASQQILLILDNIEHLLPDVEVCQALLESNPHLKILVTSRLPLRLQGEWLYQLHGFTLPKMDELPNGCAAFELFVQSARRVKHAFSPETDDQAVIMAICQRVGGMPLGIEIAASWVQYLSCAEILVELRKHLQTETSALANVLQQSWQMLTQREQHIMQILALFRGKFTREAASTIAGAELADYMGLMNKSMISRNKAGYYSLHEVMRQYASDFRLASDQHQSTAKHFVEYHLDVAEKIDTVIFGGEQLAGISRLEGEHDNFRECLHLCAPAQSQHPDMPALGLRLTGVLGMFWFLANHWKEGYGWADRFLAVERGAQPSLAQAMALLTAGGISALMDNHGVAEQYLNLGTEMATRVGSTIQSARGFLGLSVLRRLQGRYAEAIVAGQQSMNLFTAGGDAGGYQFNLVNMGHSLLWLERYDEAVSALEECIRLNQQVGYTISLPYALVNLGRLHWKRGEVVPARAYLQQSIQIAEQLGILLYHAQALCSLGWIEVSEGNAGAALDYFRKSMADYLRLGDREGQMNVMKGVAVAKALLGESASAWQFMVVAEDLAEHLKIPLLPDNQPLFVATKQQIQQELGSSLLALHRNLGRASGFKSLSAHL